MKKIILIVTLAIAPFAFANMAEAKPNKENIQHSQTVKKKKKIVKAKVTTKTITKTVTPQKVAVENNAFLRDCGFFNFACNYDKNKKIEVASNISSSEETNSQYWSKEWSSSKTLVASVPVKAPVNKPKEKTVIVRRDCVTCESQIKTYEEAKKWEGKNSRDKQDRKELTMLFNDSSIPPIDPGRLPWCAAFANAILNRLGYEGTNSLMARSFLHYGSPTKQPKVGDIVITKRGNGSLAGHVGFFEGYEEVDGVKYVKIFGGNTDKMVSTGWFPVTAVLGFRKIG
jgi:uncharacterized protein (TIGR02594 family)